MHSALVRRSLVPLVLLLAATTVAAAGSRTASATIDLANFRVQSPDADQRADVAALRQALAERDLVQDGIGVFAVPTADGRTTIVTRSPESFVLSLTQANVYELSRIESALPPTQVLPTIPLGGLSAAGGPGSRWARNNADCDIYSTEGFARTQCFEINEQVGDNDPDRRFWQYTAEASGHAKGGRKMDRLWVERRPAPGSARQEFDGIPEPKEARNRADNCVQVTEGISVTSGSPVELGFSHDWSRMTCETYRPKMYEDEGHWAVAWEGNPKVGQKDMRHVLFTMPVRTGQHGLPSWERLNGQHTTR